MKQITYLVLAIALVSFGACNNGNGSANFSGNAELNNELDSVSYSIGADIAASLKRSGAEDINVQALATGLTHGMNDDSLAISAEDGKKNIQAFFQNIQTLKLEKNKKEGEDFLAENKTKKGVITTESGLQYKIITKGEGSIPTDKDKVKVHYKGTLLNGETFDSSYDRGEPATFPVTGVIKGWQEALQLMPVGSKWIVYIPSEIAYGVRGSRGAIEPNMALIFEMELLEIVPAEEKPNK